MKKFLVCIVTVLAILLSAVTVFAFDIQPRYTNIRRYSATAEVDRNTITITSYLRTSKSMPLKIDVSVEDEDGSSVTVKKPSNSTTDTYLQHVTSASCSPGHTYTVIVNFDADGETEEVVRTVRT